MRSFDRHNRGSTVPNNMREFCIVSVGSKILLQGDNGRRDNLTEQLRRVDSSTTSEKDNRSGWRAKRLQHRFDQLARAASKNSIAIDRHEKNFFAVGVRIPIDPQRVA